MTQTLLLTIIILSLCFIGFGIGIFFFGKKARSSQCGNVPEEVDSSCPSKDAGICPIEDTSGGLKMANQNLLYTRSKKKYKKTKKK